MRLALEVVPLQLRHPWKVASTPTDGRRCIDTVLVRLEDQHGIHGWGEAPTTLRYHQSALQITRFLCDLNVNLLRFEEPDQGLEWISNCPGPHSALCALETAFLDGAARQMKLPLGQLLKSNTESKGRLTSYSIGIDDPRAIETKAREAHSFPLLKLKVGSPRDAENLAAVRSVAPDKWLRLDANEAWKTKEEALAAIETFAKDPKIDFMEQPMPADS